MPRIARIVLPGMPHHVVQRGNNRQDVFFVDDDRRAYLELLAEQSKRHGLGLLAYCLMSNHVHLIVVPRSGASLAKAVGRTHWLYSQYVNRLHGRCGHLWQNRFFSCGLDERHLHQACVYAERNPVRARIVRLAWRYAWSSAAAHVGEARAPEWLDVNGWGSLCETRGWRRELQRAEDEAETKALRLALHRGRPLGSDSFLSKVEHRLGRRIRSRPVGRPKGAKVKKKARRLLGRS
jgi:putative transposase